MSPPIFYVVRVVEEDENIVIPDLWLIKDNMCLWPASGTKEKAKKREFKPNWPKRGPIVILSAHLCIEEAEERCLANSQAQSDSVQRSIRKEGEFSRFRSSSRCQNIGAIRSANQKESIDNFNDPVPSTSNGTKRAEKRKAIRPVLESSDDETSIIIPKPPDYTVNLLKEKRIGAGPLQPINFENLTALSPSQEVEMSLGELSDSDCNASQKSTDYIPPTPRSETIDSGIAAKEDISDNDMSAEEEIIDNDIPAEEEINIDKGIPAKHDMWLTAGEKKVMEEMKNFHRYLRTIAGRVEDIKHEQRDQGKLLKSVARCVLSSHDKDKRHPVFQPATADVTMPLTTVEDFYIFEDRLSDPEIRSNLILAIRAFGGFEIGSILREAWRQVIADCLLRKFTWKGQIKKGISYEKENKSIYSSRLKMVVYEAVRWQQFKDTPLLLLDKISESFVRRARERCKSGENRSN